MDRHPIEVLSPLVADQIAAGEVVERPSSVVKELVENALDAGATKIRLDIEAGGVRRIRVLDDGAGLAADEVKTAFLRHATSKLRRIEDLDDVSTFGFRGEALPSIAAVSRISVRTRTREDIEGTLLVLQGGRVVEQRSAGCPVGTEIEVADLFFNTPARLKFLKKESTEASHCAEALVRLAALRPDVGFTMSHAGRTVRNLSRVERVEERVMAMFGGEHLVRAQGEEAGVKVLAILGPPELSRAGAGSLYTFVNGRFVRDKTLLPAIAQAFGGTLQRGQYPVGLVAIDMPPGSFDVNVHPQKTEVRFAEPQAVFRAAHRVIGQMVASAVWSLGSLGLRVKEEATPLRNEPPSVPREPTFGFEEHRLVPPPPAVRPEPVLPAPSPRPRVTDPPPGEAPPQPLQLGLEPQPQTNHPTRLRDLRYIGSARSTFLLLEADDELVIIDQHAAHERVTYERLQRELTATGRLSSQRLLTAVNLDLGPAEADRIEELSEQLGRHGLEVSRTGPDRIGIHAVPAELALSSPARLLADMVLALEEGRKGSRSLDEDHLLATMACHGSIRAGKQLSPAEVTALLSQMESIDFAGHCPHGRPVLTRLPWRELERRVHRG
ncbi:MAG: DNA mismatch repair endonuclease MutL [Myxococcota bacterium]|jgi:DNA mismatch repair protein MutL|nr:DNA mismatch repair endonuclease MutL [Myxococcota bacterium]